MEQKITLLRHARSFHNEWFIKRLYSPWLWLSHDSGIFDAPLSLRGEEQAKSLAPTFKSSDFDLVLCSPLTRAIETLYLVLPKQKVPVIITPLIRERIDRLSDTGQSLSYLQTEYPDYQYMHFSLETWEVVKHPEKVQKEPKENFLKRVRSFKEFLHTRTEKNILIVSHGNFIKTLLGAWIMIPNCSTITTTLSQIKL